MAKRKRKSTITVRPPDPKMFECKLRRTKSRMVGTRIRRFREAKGLTGAEVVEKVNKTRHLVSVPYYYQLEQGQASASWETLERISEVLEKDVTAPLK